jgi:hypothetical protein
VSGTGSTTATRRSSPVFGLRSTVYDSDVEFMHTIRRHLLAVALLLLAAQATGFLVPPGRCPCGTNHAKGGGCCCCKGGKMASGAECPMCRLAHKHNGATGHDDHGASTCRCSALCGGHDATLPWLVEIDAVLTAEPVMSALSTVAAAVPAAAAPVLDAVLTPPSPPPKAALS